MISGLVRDYCGCERAEITCGPIALVAGMNEAGKSSLAGAIGAALCNETLPRDVTKAAAGVLVRIGAAQASVELRSESGTNRIVWPQCEATAQCEPPHASRWAAGVASVATISAAERAKVLSDYLKADPNREDLATALIDAGLTDKKLAASTWALVEKHGWDGAHEDRRAHGATTKGRWRQATGQNWGARIARSWVPAQGWSFELEAALEADLVVAVGTAQTAHEAAIAAAAISGAERERLQALADELEERTDTLAAAEIEETRLETELEGAQRGRRELPPAGTDLARPCPHCGGLIVERQINLAEKVLEKAPEKIADAELKRRREAIAEADGTIGRLSGQLAEQGRAVERARDAMQSAAAASATLAQNPDAVPEVDVAGAKGKLESEQQRLATWRLKRQADELRDEITDNEAVLKILAPDGLRAKKLGRVLEIFNSGRLAPLCAAAKWKPLSVEPDMTLLYGGRPYPRNATSGKYRVRALLQVAMAQIDGSAMVVIDAAEVLDAPTRAGLFDMLAETELDALVCMTLSRREQVPDLAAAELGASYWMEAGITKPVVQLQAAAAQ
jgi:hypothetical protein